MSNAVLKGIQKVLVNLVQTFNKSKTYVDKDYPWLDILAAGAFAIRSTTNSKKGYVTVQFIFDRDMIVSIKHRVVWELILQQKQTQSNKDNMRKNRHRVDDDYKVGYKVMISKKLHTNMKFYIRAHL